MPSNIDAQPTTRSPREWSGCRLATTSPTISCIGKPGARVAPQPSSAAGCGHTPPRKLGRSLPQIAPARVASSTCPGGRAAGSGASTSTCSKRKGPLSVCAHMGVLRPAGRTRTGAEPAAEGSMGALVTGPPGSAPQPAASPRPIAEAPLSRRPPRGWLVGMEIRAGQVVVHYEEHGTGRPVLVIHGAGVDHREAEACFEPLLGGVAGLRRIYPDLPGMGRTIAPEALRSADDVLATLLDFADQVSAGTAYLLIGHSAGGYYAQAMAARRPAQVAGLALVCPLVSGIRDVPEHRIVAGSGRIGDDVFRSYFVVQTPEMLDRYERHVAPAAPLVDQAALERIGERWALIPDHAPAYTGPTVIVAGRLDSTVGDAAAVDLVYHHPHAPLPLVDDLGHAPPPQPPELLRALPPPWLP